MPHIVVKLWPGKSDQQKQELADQITESVMSVLNYGPDAVSVAFDEISPQEWAEKVYKPEIEQKWDTLVKEPGYKM